jgi:hypothetical protein
MSLIQVGLVDKTGEINPDLLHTTAAALSIQVTRDLTQFWTVQATVSVLPNPAKIPAGVWPVFLVKSLPPGEGGFHMDQHNQPFSKVIASAASEEWTIDASHEVLEMLVDPYGNRLQNSTSIEIKGGKIQDGTGQFGYLVEACDPCEADKYSYGINGIAVSDFITPRFYDPVVTTGTRYSFTGAIKAPRQILPGGYISWVNNETNQMQQLLYVDPSKAPVIKNLGPVPAGMALRGFVDGVMRKTSKEQERAPKGAGNPALLKRCKAKRATMDKAALVRGKLY